MERSFRLYRSFAADALRVGLESHTSTQTAADVCFPFRFLRCGYFDPSDMVFHEAGIQRLHMEQFTGKYVERGRGLHGDCRELLASNDAYLPWELPWEAEAGAHADCKDQFGDIWIRWEGEQIERYLYYHDYHHRCYEERRWELHGAY